jgi:aspartyl-tRNA(Asn)/glutamyl-tRNA(Gln) amidotransferase subunit B
LVELIKGGKVNDRNVKQSMINYISGDREAPVKFLEENDMLVDESIDVDKIIIDTLEGNEEAILDYKGRNEKVLNFLAGLIMRETKGSVRIDEVMEKLKEKLSD